MTFWHFLRVTLGFFSFLDILDIDLNQSNVENYPWRQSTYYIASVTAED